MFDWDESFELDLVNNKELDLLIYSWDPQYRHKLCYKGSVYLPTLLKSGPLHQLALKIEPRGTLYLRLRHTDSHSLYRRRGLSTLTLSRTSPLFGVDLETVVGTAAGCASASKCIETFGLQINRENKTGGVPGGVATGLVAGSQQVPIVIKRCVEEIERRGLDIIGRSAPPFGLRMSQRFSRQVCTDCAVRRRRRGYCGKPSSATAGRWTFPRTTFRTST